MKYEGTLLVIIYALGIIGWILNVIKIVGSSHDEAVFRIIAAIIAPIGSIAGYF